MHNLKMDSTLNMATVTVLLQHLFNDDEEVYWYRDIFLTMFPVLCPWGRYSHTPSMVGRFCEIFDPIGSVFYDLIDPLFLQK